MAIKNVKITEDQYLGVQELNRLIDSLKSAGFERFFNYLIESYGIRIVIGNELEVSAVAPLGNFKINAGVAINSSFNVIDTPEINPAPITVPPDNVQYFVVLRYKTTVLEQGTVNVSTDGSIDGVGTLFKEVLRGEPTNSVTVRFPNSTLNPSDYKVLDVDSDTEAILLGDSFQVESGLNYAVVGTFTPGSDIDNSQKLIYEYDDFDIILNTGAIQAGDIVLASVTNNGANLTVVDQRFTNQLKLIS